jgi:microcystin-dependent protein
MSSPFVAEIRIFPFNFAPTGWAFCDGQPLPISQNTALFSLLGTTYGGDGKSTFALPNMQGNAPMHPGQGPGLSLHYLGETSGSETVTLIPSEMPLHQHSILAVNSDIGNLNAPAADRSLARSGAAQAYQSNSNTGITQLNPSAMAVGGGDQPHNNMQPYLTLNFCIALQGVFPPRG